MQKQLYRAVAQTLERLTLLMEAQTDAHDALQIAQIYRQAEAIFSVGGGMSDGLMMEQYLKLGETDAALCCLKRLADAAGRPGDDAEPAIVFAPTISPRTTGKPNAAGVARHASARSAGGRGACRLRETPIISRTRLPRLEESLQKENENAAKAGGSDSAAGCLPACFVL
ncbi:MAG: hypothetical protein ACLUHE_00180 [Christensenellales bacterium]